ncbi:hypothetical protein FOZ60_016111 [Perkinsus olseni]|uniref:Uncharacterized protein n=1 Tax=Perkinsus olseni TaxID=32597 RepID=A0A7J6N4D1_PEROL|nr:hypothetical protein FOZ60_016111 [Perkinsus olseni]
MAVYGSRCCISQPPKDALQADWDAVDQDNAYRPGQKPTDAVRSAIRGSTLWGMMATCLFFPCSRAIFCTYCFSLMHISPKNHPDRVRTKEGDLARIEEFSLWYSMRAFAKHSSYRNCDHARGALEDGLSKAVYSPVLIVHDPGLRGFEAINAVLGSVDIHCFEPGLQPVVSHIRRFVNEREMLAVDDSSELGCIGGIYLPKVGRLVIYQKNASLDPTGGNSPFPCILLENTAYDRDLNSALEARVAELARLREQPPISQQVSSERLKPAHPPLQYPTDSHSETPMSDDDNTLTIPPIPRRIPGINVPIPASSIISSYSQLEGSRLMGAPMATVGEPRSGTECIKVSNYSHDRGIHLSCQSGSADPSRSENERSASLAFSSGDHHNLEPRLILASLRSDSSPSRTLRPSSDPTTLCSRDVEKENEREKNDEPKDSSLVDLLQSQERVRETQLVALQDLQPSPSGVGQIDVNEPLIDLNSPKSTSPVPPVDLLTPLSEEDTRDAAPKRSQNVINNDDDAGDELDDKMDSWRKSFGIGVREYASHISDSGEHLDHDPQGCFKPVLCPFFTILPRTPRWKTRNLRRSGGQPSVQINGEDYSFLDDASYTKDARIQSWRSFIGTMCKAGLMCDLDPRHYTAISHPNISGAAVPLDLREDMGGRLAVHSGLYSGSVGPHSRSVMSAAHLYQWYVEGRLPILFTVIHTVDKLELSSPRNEAYAAFCCRDHLELYLDIFRRWELRRPLRGDGARGPPMSFMTRALASFSTTVFEKFGDGAMKPPGGTPAEASLSRYLLLLREAWICDRALKDFGLRPPPVWGLTNDELRPYCRPKDEDWLEQKVPDDEHRRVNSRLEFPVSDWPAIQEVSSTAWFIRRKQVSTFTTRGLTGLLGRTALPPTEVRRRFVPGRVPVCDGPPPMCVGL